MRQKNNTMHADVRGALTQIDKSYKAFTNKGKYMTKEEVRAVLEYALSKGYETTSQLSDDEVDTIIKQMR
jgi:hypothetical protein